MRRLLWALPGLWACATVAPAPVSAPEPPAQPPIFLWEARPPQGEGALYLLGSVHLQRPEAASLDKAIWSALERADELVVEVDITALEEAQTQAITGRLGRLPEGEALSSKISPQLHAQLRARCEALGIDVKMLEPLRPWLVGLTLTALKYSLEGYSADAGVDRLMLRVAKQKKKPIRQLETFESQLRIFADQPEDLQALFLLEGILATDNARKGELEAMSEAYEKGDEKAMETLVFTSFEEHPELLPLRDAIFSDRNQQMAQKLKDYAKEGRALLVTVGVGHLVGEDGLVRLLEQAGFSIRRMEPQGPAPIQEMLAWSPFQEPGMRAELPDPPTSKQIRQKTQAGDIIVNQHTVNRGLIVYELVITRFPEAIAQVVAAEPSKIYDNIPVELSGRLKGQVISKKVLRYGGVEGREYMIQAPSALVRERAFMKDGRLFEARVSIVGKVSKKDGREKDAMRFLGSFGPAP